MMLNPIELLSLPTSTAKRRVQEWKQNLYFKWYEPFEYYSTWNLVMFFLVPDHVKLLQQVKFQMLFQTYMVALYMTYIYPRHIKIHYLNLEIDGIVLQFVDFLAHQCPFYYSFFFEKQYPLESIFQYIIIHFPILLYFSLEDVMHMYHVRSFDIIILSVLYSILMSQDYFKRQYNSNAE
jgi:hypothetical protein